MRSQTLRGKAPSEESRLSLKKLVESYGATTLQFTGDTTEKGNPLFTNGVSTHPISLPLLKYYVREGLVEIDAEDNVTCDKGWRIKDDAWQPKARAAAEL